MSDRDWKEYNDALVRRGEILLDWSEELKAMNEGKEGARYPESHQTSSDNSCIPIAL